MKRTFIIAAAVIALAAGVFAQEAQAPAPQAQQETKDAKYTNESIARLSYVDGKAFVQRASDLGYEEAALNMPISEGDRLSTSEGRVEVHFGRANYLRLDNDSKVDILNLPKKDDEIARIRVWSGQVYLVVGTLKKEKSIELHTADSSFYVLDRGVYRVDVRENRDTEIQVHQGLIEVAGEEGSTLLKASQRLEISEGRFASKPSSFIAVANDGFDRFNESRAAATGREIAQARLPEELSDYEGELEEYGDWTYLPPYGNVWVPGGIDDDWRPYYNGRWTWLPLSGWTWWPYDPWGWSTFHYGRWHWGLDLGWYWIPMNMWGPGWVNWWWDDYYFGWAPLSYWGYPGVIMGGMYYGHYYGAYYPYGSRALTVVRRDQLRDPHIAQNALRGDSLKSLNRMSLTNRNLSLKPAGTKISVQPLDGGRVLLRNADKGTGLTQDRRINRPGTSAGGTATSTGPRAIRKPDDPGKSRRHRGQAPERQEPDPERRREVRLDRQVLGFDRAEHPQEGRRPGDKRERGRRVPERSPDRRDELARRQREERQRIPLVPDHQAASILRRRRRGQGPDVHRSVFPALLGLVCEALFGPFERLERDAGGLVLVGEVRQRLPRFVLVGKIGQRIPGLVLSRQLRFGVARLLGELPGILGRRQRPQKVATPFHQGGASPPWPVKEGRPLFLSAPDQWSSVVLSLA